MTSSKSLRLGRFRAAGRDILANDREARRLGAAVDTSGTIETILELTSTAITAYIDHAEELARKARLPL